MEPNTISEVTRRDLFDELRLQNVRWSGRLADSDFLARIFDLKKLPSYDHRHKDMAGDIFMHREHFIDWEDDWVYDDARLNLLRCSDETFLNFLCEIVHPIVRPDQDDPAKLVDGVTGLHRASRSLASALWVARSLAAGLCGRVVVPQTEDVIKRSRASPLQASLRDDHDLLCRDRRVIGILERLRGGRGRQDHAGAEDCE